MPKNTLWLVLTLLPAALWGQAPSPDGRGRISARPYTAISSSSLTANWASTFATGTRYFVTLSSGAFPNTFSGNRSSAAHGLSVGFAVLPRFYAGTTFYAQVSTAATGPFTSLGPVVTKPSDFFPIGLTCADALPLSVSPPLPPGYRPITTEFPTIAATGINLLFPGKFQRLYLDRASNAEAKAYLDAAAANHLKVMMGIPWECVMPDPTKLSAEEMRQCITDRVSSFSTHTALAGWWLYDDDYSGLSLADLTAAYDLIKQLDPAHPVEIETAHQDLDSSNFPWRQAADIVGTALLDIPAHLWRPGESLGEIIRGNIDNAVRTLQPEGKYTMSHVQAYNLGTDDMMWAGDSEAGVRRTQARYPTEEEMRFSAFYATMRGAEGIYFNCYRYTYDDDAKRGVDDVSPYSPIPAGRAQWSKIARVASELKAMAPVLLTPTVTPAEAGITIEESPVEMMAKQYQGKTYLLTVNPTAEPAEARIELDAGRFPNPSITLLAAGDRPARKVSLEGLAFNDVWVANDTRIYVINPDDD